MLFNSYEFIFLFVPAALLGYWLAVRYAGLGAALWWLVVASLFFYSWWNPVYLPLLLASVIINYALGRRLARPGAGRRAILGVGIALNLAALFYYKYSYFLLGSVDAWLGTGFDPPQIVLPLAISFFTFQQIAYLVDSYRGLTREYSFSRYTLFVTFFPQLIAGPIVHHGEMLPQFERGQIAPRTRELLLGLSLFSAGLFKKIVLADGIAVHADTVFAAAARGQNLDLFLSWTGALCYTFQLYFDFSGYSDMAVGLALLFGIRLPINFYSPYKATSIIEFWRRWHMTLSRFLRDYLYVALGGNRRGEARRYANLFLTMLLGGIWHGAGWTFVAWGAWHGLMLVINHGWQALRRGLGLTSGAHPLYRLLAWTLTFLGVVAGWVLFRADTIDTALRLLSGMIGLHGASLPLHWRPALEPLLPAFDTLGIGFGNAALMLTYAPWLWILALGVLALAAPNLYELTARERPVSSETPIRMARWQWQPSPAWTLAAAVLAALALANLSNISQFLYFQF